MNKWASITWDLTAKRKVFPNCSPFDPVCCTKCLEQRFVNAWSTLLQILYSESDLTIRIRLFNNELLKILNHEFKQLVNWRIFSRICHTKVNYEIILQLIHTKMVIKSFKRAVTIDYPKVVLDIVFHKHLYACSMSSFTCLYPFH